MFVFCYFSVLSEPPDNVTVLSPDSSVMNVSWSHIANESANGVLQGYKVFYRSLLDDGNYKMVSVGPSTLQVVIRDNFIYTDIYEVSVAGVTAVGVGVKSESVLVQPGKGILTLQFSEEIPLKAITYNDKYIYTSVRIRKKRIRKI